MRKNRIIALSVIFLSVVFLSVGCTKDDKTVAQGITASEVNSIIIEGTWNVTLHNEAGTDNTSDFSGAIFDFNSEGPLLVTGTFDKNGTWNSTTDSGLVKITIAFLKETKGALASISKDWFVLNASNAKIELKHVSSEDESISLLTIEKN
jgi:hypothetical protein